MEERSRRPDAPTELLAGRQLRRDGHGRYPGDWAHDIHQRYGSQIHVFEPVISFADAIKARFSGKIAIHVHACGLGSRTRTETIELSADASSMYSGGGEKQSIQLSVDRSLRMDECSASSTY